MKKYPLIAQSNLLLVSVSIILLVGIALGFNSIRQGIITNLAGVQLLKLLSFQDSSHSLAYITTTESGIPVDDLNPYLRLLESTLEKPNNLPEKYIISGLYHIAYGNWKLAEEILAVCNKFRPANPVAKYWLGYAYFRQNKSNEAIDIFTSVNAVGTLVDIGDELFKAGYLEDSSNYYGLAIRVGKEIEKRSKLIQMATDNEFANIMTTRSISNTRTTIGNSYNQLGEIFLAQNLIPQALINYEEALNYYPENLGYRYNLSQIYVKRGEYDKAIEHLVFINNLESGSAVWLGALGEAYLVQGEFDDAENTLLMALKTGNGQNGLDKYWHARSNYALGTIYCQRSDWEHCLFAYSKAVQLYAGIDPSWEYVINRSFRAAIEFEFQKPVHIYSNWRHIFKWWQIHERVWYLS